VEAGSVIGAVDRRIPRMGIGAADKSRLPGGRHSRTNLLRKPTKPHL